MDVGGESDETSDEEYDEASDEEYEALIFLPDYQFYRDISSPLKIYCLWLYMDRNSIGYVMVLRSVSAGGNKFERIGIIRVILFEGCWNGVETSVRTLEIV